MAQPENKSDSKRKEGINSEIQNQQRILDDGEE